MKPRCTILVLAGIVLAAQAFAGTLPVGTVWSLNYQHNGWSNRAFDMVLDSSDNMYLGTVESNYYSGFNFGMVKVDPAGSIAWDQLFLASGFVKEGGIALTHQGNPVMTGGEYQYGTDFNLSTSMVNADGTKGWTKRQDGGLGGYDVAESVATDGLGGTFVSGTINRFGTGSPKLCVLRYSANGTLLWTNTYDGLSGTSDFSGSHIVADTAGNSYVTSTDFYKVGNVFHRGMFVRKLNPSGTVAYTTPLSSPDNVEPSAIKIDPAGNAYVVSADWVTAGGGAVYKVLATKCNPSGVVAWSTKCATAGIVISMTIDSTGAVYACGSQSGTWPQPALIINFKPLGAVGWVKTFSFGANSANAYSVLVGADGFLYVSGFGQNPSGQGPFIIKYTRLGDSKWAVDCHQAPFYQDLPIATKVDRDGDIFYAGYGQVTGGPYSICGMRLTQAPVAHPDSFTTSAGIVVSGNVEANDSYAKNSTLVLETTTSFGKLSMNSDGSFDYNPGVGFSGKDSFTYHLEKSTQQGTLTSGTVTGTVTVN